MKMPAQQHSDCRMPAFTVGQLRTVLDRLEGRDDLPVQAVVSSAPGDFIDGEVRVAVSAELDVVVTQAGPGPGQEALILLLDHPVAEA
jgi:hypothetical protein